MRRSEEEAVEAVGWPVDRHYGISFLGMVLPAILLVQDPPPRLSQLLQYPERNSFGEDQSPNSLKPGSPESLFTKVYFTKVCFTRRGFRVLLRNFTCGTLHAKALSSRNLVRFGVWHLGNPKATNRAKH